MWRRACGCRVVTTAKSPPRTQLLAELLGGLRGDRARNSPLAREDYARIPRVARALGALALVPANIARVVALGGAEPMVALVATVAEQTAATCPGQTEILASGGHAVAELARGMREVPLNVTSRIRRSRL